MGIPFIHSMPWNSHRRAACFRKEKCTLQVREPFFSLHPVCLFWCYLMLKMKHKSKINSDISTCYPPPMAFQCKEQNCHPFFRTPNQSLFCSLINLLASHQRRLYKLTPTLPPKSLQSPPPPCRVTIHFGCSDCHLTYILRVKSGCPGPSPQDLQWLHTALE